MKNRYDYEEEDNLYEHYYLQVDAGQTSMRIDKFLTMRLPNVSRNRIQNSLKAGFITVNATPCKPNYKIRPADEISIRLPEPPHLEDLVPEDIPLDIVYEDDDLMIINKPAGLVVHPAPDNWTGTLANAVHFYLLKQGLTGFCGLVHRIDKGTTGLMVVPKNELARTMLSKQFFDHSIERTYNALVWGELEAEKGTYRGNIARSPYNRKVMMVFPDGGEVGKVAVTHYKVLKHFRYVTLVQCNLETGRTHQIRIHFKTNGHPLFGDPTYGGDRILKGTVFSRYSDFIEKCFGFMPRQALHAKSLGFVHPRTQQFMQFDSELPQDMQTLLKAWSDYTAHPE
ncbi:MAG: RluA family pseudouridine synthase [Cytophagales bacterium]|nr:MAG: RluA family pseudouridine synthase [Cytophagales bacterium]TAF60943.1 MAG: RluA family pseudouridine synthase [Cytophagales bacterium]